MNDTADKTWLGVEPTALEDLTYKAAAARAWLGRRAACHRDSVFRYINADNTDLESSFIQIRQRLQQEVRA